MCRPNKGNLPEQLLMSNEPWEAKVEKMFLSVLSRSATGEERERFVKYLSVEEKNAKDAKGAKSPAGQLPGVQRMEDAMWVLVSCSEFRFNR